jgi:hypothetical protein
VQRATCGLTFIPSSSLLNFLVASLISAADEKVGHSKTDLTKVTNLKGVVP